MQAIWQQKPILTKNKNNAVLSPNPKTSRQKSEASMKKKTNVFLERRFGLDMIYHISYARIRKIDISPTQKTWEAKRSEGQMHMSWKVEAKETTAEEILHVSPLHIFERNIERSATYLKGMSMFQGMLHLSTCFFPESMLSIFCCNTVALKALSWQYT